MSSIAFITLSLSFNSLNVAICYLRRIARTYISNPTDNIWPVVKICEARFSCPAKELLKKLQILLADALICAALM
jgi:hypothetical protein